MNSCHIYIVYKIQAMTTISAFSNSGFKSGNGIQAYVLVEGQKQEWTVFDVTN